VCTQVDDPRLRPSDEPEMVTRNPSPSISGIYVCFSSQECESYCGDNRHTCIYSENITEKMEGFYWVYTIALSL
jgi:hypothetical protein